MRYLSDDGNVFNTEQECCEYENNLRHIEEERIKKEKLEEERTSRLSIINKKYEELQNLISEYEKDYDVKQKTYFAPVYELINMLCG